MTIIEDVRGTADWRGEEIEDSAEWWVALSEAHRAELLAALAHSDFPLPTLGPVLRRLADELMTGRGFALIRGIPVE
jgi:hypothetical protein